LLIGIVSFLIKKMKSHVKEEDINQNTEEKYTGQHNRQYYEQYGDYDQPYGRKYDQQYDQENDQQYDQENDQQYDQENDQQYDQENDQQYDQENDQQYDQENESSSGLDEKIIHAYEILELDVGSSFTVVKKRYRELILKYHPDKNKSIDTTEITTKIINAYELIISHMQSSYA